MPYINVKMIDDGKTQEQKDALIEGITTVFQDVVGVPASSVWIVIEDIPGDNWGISGLNTTKRRAAAAKTQGS